MTAIQVMRHAAGRQRSNRRILRAAAWAVAMLAWHVGSGAGEIPAASWSASSVPVFLRAFGTGDMAIARSKFGDAAVIPSTAALPSALTGLTGLSFAEPGGGRAPALPSGRIGTTGLDVAGKAISDTTGSLARPGALTNAPTDLPSYFLKDKTVAPHVTPDVEFGLNDRTSVGLFGQMTQTTRDDIRNNTVREGRDVGAGLTLQYKFDSR